MTRSTASFIAYDVRPEKQIERKCIVEYLNLCRQAGFEIGNYRYLGFGGTKFIDFQIMSKYVGFKSYISIEHDSDIFKRCRFNKPFGAIEMYEGEVTDYLSTDTYLGNTVFWLDLELKISTNVLETLNSAAERAKLGDVFFVTICGEPPAGLNKKGDADRKKVLRSQLPSLKAAITKIPNREFSDKQFPTTSGSLLLTLIQSAFASRIEEGRFHPHIKVIYRDSVVMCTVGGVFLPNYSRRPNKLRRLCEEKISSFCRKNEFYKIPKFNFTELEKILINKSNFRLDSGYSRRLKSLGIPLEELEEYERLSRFIPKYMESII